MDYAFGLGISSKIAIFFGAMLLLLMLYAFREQTRESKIAYFMIFLFAVTLGAFAFLGIFVVANSLQYSWIGTEAIQEEFKHGKVALRIASVMLIFKLLSLAKRLFINQESGSELWLKDKDFKEFSVIEYRKPIEFGSIIFFQYTLYISVLIFLWICTLENLHNVFVASINWAVLYIVDDWGIIAMYTAALKGRMPTLHKFRLIGINVLFAVSCTIITNMYEPNWKKAGMCGLINMLSFMSVVWLLNDYKLLKKKHGT